MRLCKFLGNHIIKNCIIVVCVACECIIKNQNAQLKPHNTYEAQTASLSIPTVSHTYHTLTSTTCHNFHFIGNGCWKIVDTRLLNELHVYSANITNIMLVYQYSGFLIIWTPIIRIQILAHWLTSPCFRQQWKKDVAVTAVLLREKAKLLYERFLPNATMPFSSSTGLGSRFTTSELAEWNHEQL